MSQDGNYLELDLNRERILLCGMPNSGKTYALCALADFIGLHSPESTIWVLDADRGLSKVKKADWPQVDNIDPERYKVARQWDDVEAFVEDVGPKQTPKDWIFIDMLGRFWEMAQNVEVSAVHGVSMGQKMLEARKQLVEDAKLQAPGSLPQPDWTVIKRLHNDDFIDRLTSSWDANIVATTSLDKLDTARDDALLVSIFATYGYKPDGEKRNPHRFDTIMFIEQAGQKRTYTTIKDRGRPIFNKQAYKGSVWEQFVADLGEKGFNFAGFDG